MSWPIAWRGSLVLGRLVDGAEHKPVVNVPRTAPGRTRLVLDAAAGHGGFLFRLPMAIRQLAARRPTAPADAPLPRRPGPSEPTVRTRPAVPHEPHPPFAASATRRTSTTP